MSGYSYKNIVNKANNIKKNVEKDYELGESSIWSYYIAKAILNPKKEISKITIKNAEKSSGDYFSRQIYKSTYIDMAERLCKYVEKKNQLPNNIRDNKNKLMNVLDYTYMFARTLVWYDKTGALPNYTEANSKAFTKPVESTNSVYEYFCKVFKKKITCIDDGLECIAGKGYGHYYDDKKSNKETIDAMANNKHDDDPNCTDSCHVMKNVADGTRKYKKVDVVHVKCKGGDGHVRLKITQKNGSVFYRDPAAVLSSGVITKNWCLDGTLLAINPYWFSQNLHR